MDREKATRILGVFPDISEDELKKKYHSLMLMTHPDVCKEHDYPYEVHEIIEAYEYLVSHPMNPVNKGKRDSAKGTGWNAPVNPNAYIERPIYQYYEDNDGEKLGIVTIDSGKYMWIADEDFSLFLKSLYMAAKQIIADDDEKKISLWMLIFGLSCYLKKQLLSIV